MIGVSESSPRALHRRRSADATDGDDREAAAAIAIVVLRFIDLSCSWRATRVRNRPDPYLTVVCGSGARVGGRRRSGSACRRRGGCVPPWRSTMSRTIARPSPVPPASRVRASSRRVKRSKMCSRSSAGMPAPSSLTVSRTRPSISSSVTVTVRGGVTLGVVEQVADRSAELAAVADRLRADTPLRVDVDPAALAQPARLAQHDVVEVDRFERQRRRRRRRCGRAGGGRRRGAAGRSSRRARCARSSTGSARRAGRGRPRARCGSGSAGCAARAMRRRRSVADGGSRPRAGRASRSSCGRGGRSRRRSPVRRRGGRGSCR